jgi:hypothetical protein
MHTHTCQTYSRVCGNHTLRVKSHSLCGNRTLRLEINLVRGEVTLVRVVITHSCLSKSYCVYKLHSSCRNHTLRVESDSVCIYHTRACRSHTCECHIHTHTCQNYTRVYVEIPLCGWKLHFVCRNRACRYHIRATQIHSAFVYYILIAEVTSCVKK